MKMTKEEKQKIGKKIGSALVTVVLVLSILLCATVMIQVMTQGYVQIGGLSVFRVVTGSMEPEIPVGALLMCKRTDIDQIQVNDIVCFRSQETQIYGEIVTHRVIGILVGDQGMVQLVTQGDANLTADVSYVTQNNFVGKVTNYSKESGIMESIVNILSDKVGFMILVLVPSLLIAGFILRSCMSNIRGELERLKEENDRREQEEKQNLYTQEEYAAMLERIRSELVEEIKHEVEEHSEIGKNNSKTE